MQAINGNGRAHILSFPNLQISFYRSLAWNRVSSLRVSEYVLYPCMYITIPGNLYCRPRGDSADVH